MKIELNEIVKMINSASIVPGKRVHVLSNLAVQIRSLAIWPSTMIEQIVEAEKTFWSKMTEDEDALKSIIGRENVETGVSLKDSTIKLVEIFITRIQPLMIEALKESGFGYRTMEEMVEGLTDEERAEIAADVERNLRERQ